MPVDRRRWRRPTPLPSGGRNPVAIEALTRGTAVAYDSINKVYLVVASHGVLHGRFIAGGGSPLGAPFAIQANPANFAHFPRVAFSPHADGGAGGFLVTWHEGGPSTHARMVSFGKSGAYGNDTQLTSDTSWWEAGAAVAYATGSQEFLVAWRSMPVKGVRRNNDIHAVRLDNNAPPKGAVIAITNDVHYQDNPSVAYNPVVRRVHGRVRGVQRSRQICVRRLAAGQGRRGTACPAAPSGSSRPAAPTSPTSPTTARTTIPGVLVFAAGRRRVRASHQRRRLVPRQHHHAVDPLEGVRRAERRLQHCPTRSSWSRTDQRRRRRRRAQHSAARQSTTASSSPPQVATATSIRASRRARTIRTGCFDRQQLLGDDGSAGRGNGLGRAAAATAPTTATAEARVEPDVRDRHAGGQRDVHDSGLSHLPDGP